MATMASYNFPVVDYDSLWAKSGFADEFASAKGRACHDNESTHTHHVVTKLNQSTGYFISLGVIGKGI